VKGKDNMVVDMENMVFVGIVNNMVVVVVDTMDKV